VANDQRARECGPAGVDGAMAQTQGARGRVRERNEDYECGKEECGDAAAFHGSGLRGLEGGPRAE